MSNNPIKVVCHRGANEYAPENTYASAQLCIDWGADVLEIDVNTSADGVMYVFHGPDLSRTTNGSGRIYEHNSEVIDQLDCGSWFDPQFAGERIPRLDEFISWIDHRITLFLDVKWAQLPDLIALIYEKQIERECFFWFGRNKDARKFRQLDTRLTLKINVTSAAEIEQAVQEYQAGIVEFSLQDCSPDLLGACQQHQVSSMILQRPNDPAAFRQIIASGVDMINLDHADHFIKILKEESL